MIITQTPTFRLEGDGSTTMVQVTITETPNTTKQNYIDFLTSKKNAVLASETTTIANATATIAAIDAEIASL